MRTRGGSLLAGALVTLAGLSCSGTDVSVNVTNDSAQAFVAGPDTPPVEINAGKDGIQGAPTPTPHPITPVVPLPTPEPEPTKRP